MRASNNIAGKSKEIDQLINGEITAGNADKLDGYSIEDINAELVGARPNTWVPTVSDLGVTATATELNYVDGVTSNIQTQLNAKTVLAKQSAAPTGNVNTIWIDTNTNIMYYWNGSAWTPIAGTWA